MMARSAGMKQAREPSAWLELVAEGDFDTGREEAAAAAEAKEEEKK